jgi:ADP-heptose:LPS heptosyltransferase
MNFPGLDPGWVLAHRFLKSAGLVRPWTLERCREELAHGASVVVVATTALGDSLLTTPLIQALHDALGRKRVWMLVREAYASLYREDPRLAGVATLGGKFRGLLALRSAWRAESAAPTIALIANMTEPDLVPGLWWCGVRGFLRYRSRWSTWPDWFANIQDMRRPGHPGYATGHAIDNNLAMAETLGMAAPIRRLILPLAPASATAPAPGRERLILVHPGASRPNKRWPADRWAEVMDGIHAAGEFRFALTGSKSERPLCAEIASVARAPSENLAGQLDLRGLAALQREASLFLSGDTGPYHLAVAMGCPTVTLFAAADRGSSVEACGPHQADPDRHRILATGAFGDSITTISSGAVLEAAAAVLVATGATRP